MLGGSIYHINGTVTAIRERIIAADITLETIGTTEAELEQLLKDAPINVARKIIERIRAGIYKYGDVTDLSYCLTVGAKLEDLETNEAEIASLTTKYHKLHCKYILEKIRKGESVMWQQTHVSSSIIHLREWVTKYQLTLADIGTNEDELSALIASDNLT